MASVFNRAGYQKSGGMIPDRYNTVLVCMIPWAVWTAGIIVYQTTQKLSEVLKYHCLTPCKGWEDFATKLGAGKCVFCCSLSALTGEELASIFLIGHTILLWVVSRMALVDILHSIASKLARWYYSVSIFVHCSKPWYLRSSYLLLISYLHFVTSLLILGSLILAVE